MYKTIIFSVIFSFMPIAPAFAQSASEVLNTAYLHAVRCNNAMDYRENVTNACSKFLDASKRFVSRHRTTSQRLDMNKMVYVGMTSKRVQAYYGR